MESNNMLYYEQMRTPPPNALKNIEGGKLKNKTSIKPMWRIQVLTEIFGPCGIGWYYKIIDQRVELGVNDVVVACVTIELYIKHQGEWSMPIVGIGGSELVKIENQKPVTSKEAYKMALTDAISVACKALGVGADIYNDDAGNNNNQQYNNRNSNYNNNYSRSNNRNYEKPSQAPPKQQPSKKDVEAYNLLILDAKHIVRKIIDSSTANAAMPKIKGLKHILTSERDIGILFNNKIKELNLFYNKILKEYQEAPNNATRGERYRTNESGDEKAVTGKNSSTKPNEGSKKDEQLKIS